MAATSSSAADSVPACWKMYGLPPFYTLQRSPATFLKQAQLWADLLTDLSTRARDAVQGRHEGSALAVGNTERRAERQAMLNGIALHFRIESPVFAAPSPLRCKLSEEAVAAVFEEACRTRSGQCLRVGFGADADDSQGDGSAPGGSIVVLSSPFSWSQIEASVLSWVLDKGAGTTSADLAATGAVFTIDEMVDGGCLTYQLGEGDQGSASSSQPSGSGAKEVPKAIATSEAVAAGWIPAQLVAPQALKAMHASPEMVLRSLLAAVGRGETQQGSPLSAYSVALFNLDGSDRHPYEGVKIGG